MTTLVVTDLDGTLWDNDMRCHRATLAAAAALLERSDVVLIAATGRRLNSARAGLAENGIELPAAVLLNGALGHDFSTGTLFHQAVFERHELSRTLDRLGDHRLSPIVYRADGPVLALEGVTTSVRHIDSLGSDLHWTVADEVAVRQDVVGLSMLGIDESVAKAAAEAFAGASGVEVVAYADHLYPPFSLMIAPAATTKEVGIRAYLAHADIRPGRIVALGDGGNDVEMLAMADVALVVEGADPRALELADVVIDGPAAGGWAAVLDHVSDRDADGSGQSERARGRV